MIYSELLVSECSQEVKFQVWKELTAHANCGCGQNHICALCQLYCLSSERIDRIITAWLWCIMILYKLLSSHITLHSCVLLDNYLSSKPVWKTDIFCASREVIIIVYTLYIRWGKASTLATRLPGNAQKSVVMAGNRSGPLNASLKMSYRGRIKVMTPLGPGPIWACPVPDPGLLFILSACLWEHWSQADMSLLQKLDAQTIMNSVVFVTGSVSCFCVTVPVLWWGFCDQEGGTVGLCVFLHWWKLHWDETQPATLCHYCIM